MKTTKVATLGAMLLVAAATPAPAQQGQGGGGDFSWSEPVAEGAWLRIRNYKGPVEIHHAEGRVVEVRARRISSRGSTAEVRYEVVRDGQNVTLCAMPEAGSTCDAEGLRSQRRSERQRGAEVAFTVLVPRGVKVNAATGNGAVTVRGVASEVVASSGNGAIRVAETRSSVRASSGNGTVEVTDAGGPVNASTGNGRVQITTAQGPVNASSGNGDIDVRFAALHDRQDMRFSTGNGAIRVRLPRNFQGEIDASTGHGGITSDFPVTVQGSVSRNRLRGTIGDGGSRIRMSTGNGSLALQRVE